MTVRFFPKNTATARTHMREKKRGEMHRYMLFMYQLDFHCIVQILENAIDQMRAKILILFEEILFLNEIALNVRILFQFLHIFR